MFNDQWRQLLPSTALDGRRTMRDRAMRLAERRGQRTMDNPQKRRGLLIPDLGLCRRYYADHIIKAPMTWVDDEDLPLCERVEDMADQALL